MNKMFRLLNNCQDFSAYLMSGSKRKLDALDLALIERIKNVRGDASNREKTAIAGRIRESLRGENVAALARAMGVSRTSIYDWSTGKSMPDVERVAWLAGLLGLSVSWLITGRGARREEDELPEGYVLLSATRNIGEAGKPPGRIEGVEHLAFRLDWLRRLPGSPKPESLLLTQASGDAMAPTIRDSDLLLLNLADGRRQLRDGVYAILVLTEPVSFVARRVQRRGDGFRVLCDNSAYGSDDDTEFANRKDVIFGRIVWRGGFL